MCRLKSGIILKDQVFIPDYDSHIDMLEELNIKDDIFNARTLFVRAELLPINGNIFSDVSTWYLNVDQDILPDWFIYDYEKQRMIEAVKKWSKNHIFENVDELLELKGNDKYYLKNCKNVEAYDSCDIIAYGDCTINAYDNCIIYAYDDCTINAFNNCTIKARDKCTINAHNNCSVCTRGKCVATIYDNCKVHAFDNCTINTQDKKIIYLYDNCTINAQNNCRFYRFDHYILNVHDKSITKAYDNCTVNAQNKCKIYYG